MALTEMYRGHITLQVGLPRTFEQYEIQLPTVSLHNLLFGQLYIDVGGRMTVRNLTTREYAHVDF
jgi:hypothetical protein